MSVIDPQTISFDDGVTDITCPKTLSTGRKSVYESQDGATSITLSHQITKARHRMLFRVDRLKNATDPFTAEVTEQRLSTYTVVDRPSFGFTDQEIIDTIHGMVMRFGTTAPVDDVLITNMIGRQH